MNEEERSLIKHGQPLTLNDELDLENCIEEFDRIIFQVPPEFTVEEFGSDEHQSLTNEFTFTTNLGDGERG